MVDFWFNHFNVFAGKGQVRVYLTEYERDAIRPHVLGKFRDLLGAPRRARRCSSISTTGRARGTRCGDVRGRRADARRATAAAVARPALAARRGLRARRRGRAADQPPPMRTQPPQAAAPPRPQRELRARADGAAHARRRRRLHPEGRAGGGARVHRLDDRQPAGRAAASASSRGMHDDGEKVVLGHGSRPAAARRTASRCSTSWRAHPSTARFIATKLARRFVADEPPPALVDARPRHVPRDRRRHPRGRADDRDVAGVLRGRAVSRQGEDAVRVRRQRRARRPGTEVANALPLVAGAARPGHAALLCQPPTGYADRAEAWVNTGALLNRMNFAVALTARRHARRSRAASADRTATPDETRQLADHDCPRRTRSASPRPRPSPRRAAPRRPRRSRSARPNSRKGRTPMISRRIFLKNGGLALVSLGFAPRSSRAPRRRPSARRRRC